VRPLALVTYSGRQKFLTHASKYVLFQDDFPNFSPNKDAYDAIQKIPVSVIGTNDRIKQALKYVD
jgi:hypothetical protein